MDFYGLIGFCIGFGWIPILIVLIFIYESIQIIYKIIMAITDPLKKYLKIQSPSKGGVENEKHRK